MKHTAPTTTLESRTLWHNIVSTIIILAIATILAFSFFHITQSDPANIALIYILALIIIARITTGYFFGIISAFFCVIFINWCFTYPYFEVSFAISGYPVTFVFLLTISMIVSTLTTRLKKQDKMILDRERAINEADVPIFCGLFHMICVPPLHPSSDLLILLLRIMQPFPIRKS